MSALFRPPVRDRAELSRLVDAAFDALPAVETAAAAIDTALGDEPVPAEKPVYEPEPMLVGGPDPDLAFEPVTLTAPRKRGFFRRVFARS